MRSRLGKPLPALKLVSMATGALTLVACLLTGTPSKSAPAAAVPAVAKSHPVDSSNEKPQASTGTDKSHSSEKPVPPEPRLSQLEQEKAIAELRSKHLLVPIQGANPESIKGSFYELRGDQLHHAADFLAPRNTPILAVEDGAISKLFLSKAGGITIYESDPTAKYIYYYAHLERYADNLKEGDKVKRGQVIGFVGTSGNAPPNTPHLHFSIGKMMQPHQYWNGAAIDPYEVLSGRPAVSVRKPVQSPPSQQLNDAGLYKI